MDKMTGSEDAVTGHAPSQCLVAIGRLQVTSSPNSNDLLGGNGNSNEFISRHSTDGKFTFVDQRYVFLICCLKYNLKYFWLKIHFGVYFCHILMYHNIVLLYIIT